MKKKKDKRSKINQINRNNEKKTTKNRNKGNHISSVKLFQWLTVKLKSDLRKSLVFLYLP